IRIGQRRVAEPRVHKPRPVRRKGAHGLAVAHHGEAVAPRLARRHVPRYDAPKARAAPLADVEDVALEKVADGGLVTETPPRHRVAYEVHRRERQAVALAGARI